MSQGRADLPQKDGAVWSFVQGMGSAGGVIWLFWGPDERPRATAKTHVDPIRFFEGTPKVTWI